MTDPEFIIPMKPEDLLNSEDPVEDIELSSALHDLDGNKLVLNLIFEDLIVEGAGVVDRLCDQSTSISNHENLDVLFSLVRYVGYRLPPT